MNLQDTVQCHFCHQIFTDAFSPETNQAFHCASDFISDDDGSYILSHFGSSFDTSKFIVKNNSSFSQQDGVICDQCIQSSLDKKEIIEDKNYQYWSTLEDVQFHHLKTD